MINKGKHSVGVIGSGFAGLAASAILAKEGKTVHLFEKNADLGGRARKLEQQGFVFDMGPSWYWMPEVFEKFYNLFGHTASDFYGLKKLDPGFRIIYGNDDIIDVPANFDELIDLFEKIENGSGVALKKFMAGAEYKYQVGMDDLVYKPGNSFIELLNYKTIAGVFKLEVFTSFRNHVKRYFKNPRLISLLEFPILFLGAMPADTPALYSLMNYAGLKLGTFYPAGGFSQVSEAFKTIASQAGVNIHNSETITKIEVDAGIAKHVVSVNGATKIDAIIGAADYHHIENNLLDQKYRTYPTAYWDKKTFAPSCLIFYLGINKKINNLLHHNLFFDGDFEQHSHEIYKNKKWPENPLFYVCCPSKTDDTVAPAGFENLFILMPIAIGLNETDEIKENYYNLILDRLEKYCGEKIKENVIYNKSYCVSDFISDYNAYKGNAYGLANTLFQTSIFKPKMRSKKIKNMFFAGQLTVPGPGVPPSIISGQVAANELLKYLKTI